MLLSHPTVLVTHSLRSYREALSSWLRAQRPAISVAECEPRVLDLARARYAPYLVICDAPTPAMRRSSTVLAWIELRPPGGSSLVHLGDQERPAPDLALPEILEIVDAAQDWKLEQLASQDPV